MPFVVPGVCRFALRAEFGGRQVVNVWDIRIDTTGSSMDRGDAIEDQAAILIENTTDHISPLLVNDMEWKDVAWVDLDDEDGSTGSTSSGTGGINWPDAGNVTTAPIPGNTAVLVTKQVPSARGRRNGRSYVCGIPEADTSDPDPNSLTGGALTAWQTAWDNWIDAVNQDGDPFLGYSSRCCVVHILTREPSDPGDPPGAPLTGESHDITSLAVQGKLATQRRRLRG